MYEEIKIDSKLASQLICDTKHNFQFIIESEYNGPSVYWDKNNGELLEYTYANKTNSYFRLKVEVK